MSESPALRPLVDDPEHIADTDSVLRVVPPAFFTGDVMQSRAFQDQALDVAAHWGLAGNCASVALRSIWEEQGSDLDALLADFAPGSRLAEISVGSLRNLCNSVGEPMPQGLMLDPRPSAPWHVVMFSLTGSARSKGAMRAIVEAAAWFQPQ